MVKKSLSDDVFDLISLYNEFLADNINLPIFVTSDHDDMSSLLSDCFRSSFQKLNDELTSIKENLDFLKKPFNIKFR